MTELLIKEMMAIFATKDEAQIAQLETLLLNMLHQMETDVEVWEVNEVQGGIKRHIKSSLDKEKVLALYRDLTTKAEQDYDEKYRNVTAEAAQINNPYPVYPSEREYSISSRVFEL